MPFLLFPALSLGAGFVAGWWAGDSLSWVKWLIIAAFVFFCFHKVGVI